MANLVNGAVADLSKIIPSPFFPLFVPARWRYKVFHGGRGGAKSKSCARAVVLLCDQVKLNVLYAREFQNSIADSSHRDLVNEIDELGLSARFDIGRKEITNLYTGSRIIFKGLRHNFQAIKSTSGIDLCVIEEAESVPEESWEVLDPTIRSEHSELWIIFNTVDPDGATYQRFVKNPPPDAYVRKVNYDENPFFPDVLRKQMEHCRATDPEAYAHIWLGEPKTVGDSQVLRGRYSIRPFDPQPDWSGPHFGADWGYSVDPTAMVRCWVHGRKLYIEYEAYGVGVDIDDTPALFDAIPGARTHLSRADNCRPETISYMNRHGYKQMTACKKWPGSVEDGVEHLRSYEEIVIHPRCKNTAAEARLWSWKTDRLTRDVLPVLAAGNDHCWDAVRYALEKLIARRNPIKTVPSIHMNR